MSDSVQMTLIADTPTAGDVAGLGMSSERDLAAAAWAVARRGALAELSEPEAALVGQLGPILDCSGPGSAGGSLVGVEIDPLAALLARANLTAAGFDDRSRVVVHDYRTADLGEGTGATAYLGNPPYVRHHQIEPPDKAWLARRAATWA